MMVRNSATMNKSIIEMSYPNVVLHEEITLTLYAAIGMVGLFGNMGLILVHITNPSLRQKYILSLGLSDFVVCGNFIAMRIAKFVHPARWTQANCMILVSAWTFSMSSSTVLTLAVGIDRILAIKAKTKYKQASTILSKVTIAVILIYPSITIGLGNYFSRQTIVPTCLPPSGLGVDIAFPYWIYSTAILNLLVAAVYVSLGISVRERRKVNVNYSSSTDGSIARRGPRQSMASNRRSVVSLAADLPVDPSKPELNAANPRNQKMIGSILIVASIHVMSWTFTSVFLSLVELTGGSSVSFNAVASLYLGLLAVINNSCNPYIYCLRSKEQRKAYADIIAQLIGWCK